MPHEPAKVKFCGKLESPQKSLSRQKNIFLRHFAAKIDTKKTNNFSSCDTVLCFSANQSINEHILFIKLFSGANGVKITEKADFFKNIFVKLFRPNSTKRVRNIQLYPNAMNAYDNVSNRLYSGGIL